MIFRFVGALDVGSMINVDGDLLENGFSVIAARLIVGANDGASLGDLCVGCSVTTVASDGETVGGGARISTSDDVGCTVTTAASDGEAVGDSNSKTDDVGCTVTTAASDGEAVGDSGLSPRNEVGCTE